MLKILGTAPLSKKRLDSGEAPDAKSPEAKRPRLGPLLGFVPCLQPLAPSPSAEEHDTRVLQIGPYVLLEPRDGGRSYRAVHRPTEAEYSCKVRRSERALELGSRMHWRFPWTGSARGVYRGQ